MTKREILLAICNTPGWEPPAPSQFETEQTLKHLFTEGWVLPRLDGWEASPEALELFPFFRGTDMEDPEAPPPVANLQPKEESRVNDEERHERDIERVEMHVHHHVYLHADKPVTINLNVTHLPTPVPPVVATRAILTIGGQMANVTISIDDLTKVASTKFEDDHGDTDAPAPAGYVPAHTSDNPAVLTIDPTTYVVTPVAEGQATVTDPIQDASGNPIPLPNGTGNFAPATAVVTIGPGLAVAAVEAVG